MCNLCKFRIGLESSLILLNDCFSQPAINRRKSSLFLTSPLQLPKVQEFGIHWFLSFLQMPSWETGLISWHCGCCSVGALLHGYLSTGQRCLWFVHRSSQWFPVPWIQNCKSVHLLWTVIVSQKCILAKSVLGCGRSSPDFPF